ncbi:MAG TPA: polysaccharide deacetylase family protein [Accumulibacter sp.]|uniref:polysaccharide deacetylase family protein n=1 Tax=Accumulibacter sp. TaxID=2053492 RepID=UPI002CBDE5C9|nr:polysaccharide deacetylase family protein [Accumulibacter sp.]HMW54788.1 polysaccharide deacetylase family protein [Accumulibacter sp.]HNG77954.1 polysaccharide deacetylase family protein [Burkholderiaceae bacterium]
MNLHHIVNWTVVLGICATLNTGCGGGTSGACSAGADCQQEVGAYNVSLAQYPGNRLAAVSYTFDDGSRNSDRIIGLFDGYGLKATFFVIAGLTGEPQWSMWKTALGNGHEIGSHSFTHTLLDNDKLTDQELAYEIVDSKVFIGTKIGLEPEVFAFPGNKYNSKSLVLARENYSAIRFPFEQGETGRNILYLGATSTVTSMNAALDAAVESGIWLTVAGHSVDGAGYSPVGSEVLRAHISYAASRRDKIWIETFGKVAKYRRCWSASRPQLIIVNNSEWRVDVITTRPDCTSAMTVLIQGGGLNSGRKARATRAVRQISNEILVDVVPGQSGQIYFEN